MLRILAATTLVLSALCNECMAQSAKLEVVFAVLDTDTVKAIAESPYLRDFSGLDQQTMQGTDEGHYHGIYISGRENYVELFGPADLNLDGPAAAVGCSGVELNVERVGGLEQLKPLAEKSGPPVEIRTFHREFDGRTVDWFKELGTPAQLAGTIKCPTPMITAAIAEYVPSYLVVTLEFVSSRKAGLREVDFALNSTPGMRHVETLGHSRLVVGPGADAAWSFEPR